MGVVGVVMTAVFSLYLNTRTTAHTQEEVVEIQQSLRIAADQIARDIRLAGFMLPEATSPIQTADEASITLRTSTMTGRMARINESFTSPSDDDTPVEVVVASSDMAAFFAEEDWVRIIRPPNKTQPAEEIGAEEIYEVVKVNIEDQTIRLKGFTAAVLYNPGDIIVGVHNTFFPETITYTLNGMTLERNQEPLAARVAELSFQYLLNNGGDIRAVRFTLTGISEDKGQGEKTRRVTQLTTLRN
jgi:hypothetical protein